MKIQSQLIIIMITSLMLASLCFDSGALSAKVYLNELATGADYVILGFVKERNQLRKREQDQFGKVISFDKEGVVCSISVKEVLFAKKPSWRRMKEIYNFQKHIGFDRAILIANESYLLFLKEDSMDNTMLIKKYNLPRDKYFTVFRGRQGQIDSSDLLFINATRMFYKIMKLKDENKRIEEWKKLLKSDNLILRKCAKDELKKVAPK